MPRERVKLFMKVNVKDLKNELEFTFEDISVEEFKTLWSEQKQVKGLSKTDNNLRDSLNKCLPIKTNKKESERQGKFKNADLDFRLKQLESFLPNVNFIVEGKSILTEFNGSVRKVRIKEMKTNEREWSFTRMSDGDLVLLLKDKKLDGIFIARKDWISPSGSLHVTFGSARYTTVKMNGQRVINTLHKSQM